MLNGVSAVPIMAAMMVVASSRGDHGPSSPSAAAFSIFGWAATAVMALASGAMLFTSFGS